MEDSIVSSLKELHTILGNPTDTEYYISTPWGNLSSDSRDNVVTECGEIVDDMAGYVPSIKIIDVYEKLIEANSKSIIVLNGNKLNSEGTLLVSGLYCRSLSGQDVTGITEFEGISSVTAMKIVEIINSSPVEGSAPKATSKISKTSQTNQASQTSTSE